MVTVLGNSLLNEKLYKFDFEDSELKSVSSERIDDYENLGLYKVFLELADKSFSLKNKPFEFRKQQIVKEFNILINKNKSDFKNSDSDDLDFWKLGQECKLDVEFFSPLFLNKHQEVEGRDLIKEFNKAYVNVRDNGNNETDRFFRLDDVEKYLDAYLALCKFLFNVGGIFQDEVRTSKIIEDILNIEYCKESNYFTFTSPFSLFTILRTLEYIARLPQNIPDYELEIYEDTKSLNRRKHMVATYAIHSFTRFTMIDGVSYVINYSRRKKRLICKSADACSSIENVKPIRLFEKIISHLTNIIKSKIDIYPNGIGKINLEVSVMGFCSTQEKAKENKQVIDAREINDLIFEIFSWYEDVRNNEKNTDFYKNTVLELNLNYYKSENENSTPTTQIFKYITDNDEEIGCCTLKIQGVAHKKYNRHQLKKSIEDSDIVFLLDCPWISIEDFYSVNHGDIFTYTSWLNDESYKKDISCDAQGESVERPIFSKDHLFYSINNQLNRIAVDNFSKYGQIVRIPKKYLIDWIVQEMDNYRRDGDYKTLYLYSSSVAGMMLSDYVNYPIIRKESYNNKTFNIMRFSSRNNSVLEKSTTSKMVSIDLWSFLKYIDISFVLVSLKDYLSENFYSVADVGSKANENEKKRAINRDIISICRSIIFDISYLNIDITGNTKIKIDVGIYEPVYQKIQLIGNNKKLDALMMFFKNTIKDVIFENSNGVGDNSIRNAFESCLYSKAGSVEDLFFLYDYRQKRKNSNLNSYVVDFILEFKQKDYCSISSFDAFSDKRLYNKLFEHLSLSMPSKNIIYDCLRTAETLYPSFLKESHARQMLQNTKDMCETYNYTDSYLMKNAEFFLREVNLFL